MSQLFFLEFSAFKKLWKQFLGRSGTLLLETVGEEKDLELIVWSSDLTGSEHMDSLPPDTFTVQVSAAPDGGNSQIDTLAEKGYNVILSHQISNPGDRFCKGYDGNLTNKTLNSSIIRAKLAGWREDYKADPYKMSADGDVLSNVTKSQVLGGEMVLWTKLVSFPHVQVK